MGDGFSCRKAERIIPAYVKGRCTEAEKRFLEKHCSECIECSVKLIHERNKLEVLEDSRFDRDYAASSAHVYDAEKGRTSAMNSRESEETFSGEGERWTFLKGPGPWGAVLAAVITLSIALGVIASFLATFSSNLDLESRLDDFLESMEEDDASDDELEALSDYSGPVEVEEDHVIEWKDPVLEEKVREAAGIESGDIMYSDVLSITWINLDSFVYEEDGDKISDISNLAEFKNLTDLSLCDNMIEDISPLGELADLEYLNLSSNMVSDLEAVREMKNLKGLYLTDNQISDLGPLEDLTALEYLDLDENQISDIIPLRKLVNLYELSLQGNRITDISPLENMKELSLLDLGANEIREVDILKKLTNLEHLGIYDNPIEDESVLDELDADVYY